MRKTCFPNIKLQTKDHYCDHCSDLFEEFGPPKHVQTLRLETLHRLFKNAVKHAQNFRNVTKTLAIKYQRKQSLNENNFVDRVISFKYFSHVIEQHYENVNILIRNYFSEKSVKELNLFYEVQFRGMKYSQNMPVCVGKSTRGNFVLYRIEFILINGVNANIYFIGRMGEIIPFFKLGVYEILFDVQTSHYVLRSFPFSSLLYPDPFAEIVLNSFAYYVRKYVPFDPDM